MIKQTGKHALHASFSADGRRVRTANANGVLSTWDFATVGWAPPQRLLVPSESGKHWLTIESNAVALFDGHNPAVPVKPPKSFPAVADARLNYEGNRVVLLSERLPWANGVVQAQCWDLRTGPLASMNLGDKVQDALLSCDGKWLVALADTNALLWDTTSQSVRFTLAHPKEGETTLKAAAFSADGHWLATTYGGSLFLWDTSSGKQLFSHRHVDELSHVAFSPDGRWLVASCDSHGTLFERDAYVYHVKTGALQCSVPHRDGVLNAEFSADSRRLLTASEDNTAQVWDPVSGRPLFGPLRHVSQVKNARFSPDARWIVTACDWARSAQLWDAVTGEALTPRLKHPWGLDRAQFVNGRTNLITREKDKPRLSALWTLHSDRRDTNYLTRLSRLLSGSPAGEGGKATKTAAEWRATWNELRAQYPSDFEVTPEQMIDWDIRQAEACERADQWSLALSYWRHLLHTQPDNSAFRHHQDAALEVLFYQPDL
jgi:WD40 repeat protein